MALRILKTTAAMGHFHLVLLDDMAGSGATSEDRGHRHPAIRSTGPALPQVTQDANGNPVEVPAVAPAFTLEDWGLGPDPEDGHYHEIIEMVSDSATGEDPDMVAAQCVKEFLSCIDRETESRKREDESEDFYCGDQWEPEIRSKLAEQERACVTINHCEGVVDDLMGYLRQNRKDFQILPVEGSDQKQADLWTVILKVIATSKGLAEEEDLAFEDLVVMGRESIKIFRDDEGPEPEIGIAKANVRDTYFGYHERRDMKDCYVRIFARWMSLQEMEAMYPDKFDTVASVGEMVSEPIIPTEGAGGATRANPNLFDLARKDVRVYEIYRKEFSKKPLITLPDGTFVDGTAWKTAEATKARTLPGVSIEWKPKGRIRKTIMAGTALLEDFYPDLPPGVEGEIFSAYAKYRKNKWWGKLEAGKDPQREINKRHSQGIDVLNKVAPYGYFWDKKTFPTKDAADDFKNNASQPGFTQEVSDVNRPPRLAEGIRAPTELYQAVQTSKETFYTVLSHDRSWLTAPPDTSGDALQERRRAGMAANEFLFDNHAKFMRQIGKALIAWVQHIYTPNRIARMVIGRATEEQLIAGEPATEYTEQDIIELLRNTDATKFDVVVAENPWSPTNRRANFRNWSEMRKNGVQVPDEILVDMADLPLADRKKIKAAFAAQAQAQQNQADTKMKMELGKTAIAKGIPPGAVGA